MPGSDEDRVRPVVQLPRTSEGNTRPVVPRPGIGEYSVRPRPQGPNSGIQQVEAGVWDVTPKTNSQQGAAGEIKEQNIEITIFTEDEDNEGYTVVGSKSKKRGRKDTTKKRGYEQREENQGR